MSRRHLTSKQHAFLQYLHGHLREHRVWPTYREIVQAFGYRSPNSVTQNLQALARKGYLKRDQNGYQLVDRAADEGAITVRAAFNAGAVTAPESPERLSLATLLPDLGKLQAVRIEDGSAREGELGQAQYVLLDGDEVEEGQQVVVLHQNALSVRNVGSGGVLEDPAGSGPPISTTEAQVLGRYAGHAGPYGLVRASLSERRH